MKILVLCDDFPPQSFGGAGIIAFNLAREFQKNGHMVLVVTTVRTAAEAGETVHEGLKIIRLRSSYPLKFQSWVCLNNIPVVRQVKAILREFKPDVVHAHNVHSYLSYVSLKAAKRSGARVILTAHDVMSFTYSKLTEFIDRSDLSVPDAFNYRISPFRLFMTYRLRYNPFRNLIIRHIFRKYVDCIIAVSEALRQAMADNGIGRASVIHNGIDTDDWEEPLEDIEAFRHEHGLGESAVLFGGRLSGIKGAQELIEALSSVRSSVPDVQLLIVGQENRYSQRMIEIAGKLDLVHRLIFTGWLSGKKLHLAYRSAALAAVPSLCFDSFPTVNLEAMACGKPVIATCFGGSREIVVDGKTGYVVNPYDIPAMAQKIADLLSDRDKSLRFGQAGSERVRGDFSLAECARRYEAEFQGLDR